MGQEPGPLGEYAVRLAVPCARQFVTQWPAPNPARSGNVSHADSPGILPMKFSEADEGVDVEVGVGVVPKDGEDDIVEVGVAEDVAVGVDEGVPDGVPKNTFRMTLLPCNMRQCNCKRRTGAHDRTCTSARTH